MPNEALTDEAPVYERPWVEPANPAAARGRAGAGSARRPRAGAASTLLASPNVASKRWIYRQYDSHGAHEHARRARAPTRRSCA